MKLDQSMRIELYDFIHNGDYCPTWLEEWAVDHWAGDIPYGTLTGDEATMDEWLSDRVDSVEDYFSDQLELERNRRGDPYV